MHYLGDVKCTLMADSSPGDIEVQVTAATSDNDKERGRHAIRLRLKRKKHILEISRCSAKPSGETKTGEWVKKVIALDHALELSQNDWIALDALERQTMGYLSDFLSVCEVVERADERSAGRKLEDAGPPRLQTGSQDYSSMRSGWVSRSGVASSVVVQPRPRKFSPTNMLQ